MAESKHRQRPVAGTPPGRLARICRQIIRFEWVVLAALILPIALFPTPTRMTTLLLLPVLWGARKIGWGRFIPATPVDWPLFGLLLMILVSIWATFDLAFSIGKVAGLTYGIAVFYAMVAFAQQSRRHLWLGVSFLLAAGWGVVVLGILGTKWTNKFPLMQSVMARLPHQLVTLPGADAGFGTNQVAGVLLWVAPLALVLTVVGLMQIKTTWRGLRPYQTLPLIFLLAATSAATVGVIILTQSRGALVGFGMGLLLMILVVLRRINKRLLWGASIVIVLGVGVSLIFFEPEEWTALLFEQVGLDTNSDQIDSFDGRLEIWSRAIYGIQDFPFTGMGMNNFRRVMPILYPLFLVPPDRDMAHAHNHLLQAALDLGLPGLIAYLALWLVMAALLWQSWRQAESLWLRALALGFAGSLAAYFVYGQVDAVALGAKPGFIFWLLLGLIVSLHGLVRQKPTAVSEI